MSRSLSSIRYTPQDILRYPNIGTQYSTAYYASDTEQYILYLGAGNKGVVRTIWVVPMIALADKVPWSSILSEDVRLRIYTDTGDLPDADPGGGLPWKGAPPAENLDCDIPLTELLGARYNATGNVEEDTIESEYLSTETHPQAALPGDNGFGLQLTLPIPFSNGIFIKMYSATINISNRGAYA